MRKRREDKGTKQAGTVSVDECMKRNARDGIGDIGLGKECGRYEVRCVGGNMV